MELDFYLLLLGVPLAFLIGNGIESPTQKNLIWLAMFFFIIWNAILSIIGGFIEDAIVSGSLRQFNSLYSANSLDRQHALDMLSQISAYPSACKALRSHFKIRLKKHGSDDTASDDEAEATDQQE